MLAQIAPSLGDLEGNLATHLAEIRRAEKSGADLIVFPELSLTGYLLQDLVADCAQDPASSPLLGRLAKSSGKVAVLAGFVELDRSGTCYNSAICFHREAAIHKHRKVYLPTYGMFDEARYFGAGDVFRSFDAPWGRTGVLICEDFWHLSSSYLLSQQGMEVLVVMSNSPTKGLDASSSPAGRTGWLRLGEVVASFLTCHVIYVNRTGYEDGWNYGGGSYALSPQGRLVADAKLFKTDSVIATLPHADLRSRRTAFPILRDEKLDLVRREVERIAAGRYGGA